MHSCRVLLSGEYATDGNLVRCVRDGRCRGALVGSSFAASTEERLRQRVKSVELTNAWYAARLAQMTDELDISFIVLQQA